MATGRESSCAHPGTGAIMTQQPAKPIAIIRANAGLGAVRRICLGTIQTSLDCHAGIQAIGLGTGDCFLYSTQAHNEK
ncbi:MAG: hypothetical protein JW829_02500 [Pirellulales bacterium]|nr:hypothetical protein [Pirellulales bacterium]